MCDAGGGDRSWVGIRQTTTEFFLHLIGIFPGLFPDVVIVDSEREAILRAAGGGVSAEQEVAMHDLLQLAQRGQRGQCWREGCWGRD